MNLLQKLTNLFGRESTMYIKEDSAQARYYMFLRRFYLGKDAKLKPTHKCYFYQGIAWGTLLMLLSFVLIIPGFIYTNILKGIFHLIRKPEWALDVKEAQIESSTIVMYTIATVIGGAITAMIYGLFVGYADMLAAIYWVFAFPWAVLVVIGIILSGIWTGLTIVAVYLWSINMDVLYYGTLAGLGIAGVFIVYLVIYKLASFIMSLKWIGYLTDWFVAWRGRKNKRKVEAIELKKEAKAKLEPKPKKYRKSIDFRGMFEAFFGAIALTFIYIWKFFVKYTSWIWKPVMYLFIGFFAIIKAIIDITGNHCPPMVFLQTNIFEIVRGADGESLFIKTDNDDGSKKAKLGLGKDFHRILKLEIPAEKHVRMFPKKFTGKITWESEPEVIAYKNEIKVREIEVVEE